MIIYSTEIKQLKANLIRSMIFSCLLTLSYLIIYLLFFSDKTMTENKPEPNYSSLKEEIRLKPNGLILH